MISISVKLGLQEDMHIHFPTALRKLSIALFVIGFAPFIAEGAVSHNAAPAAGIAILFFSALLAILDLLTRGIKLGGEGRQWIKKTLLLLADFTLLSLDIFMIVISYIELNNYWSRYSAGIAIFGSHCIFFLYADVITHVYCILHCFASKKKENNPASNIEEGRPARFQPYTDADVRNDAETGETSQGVTEASIDASKN